MISTTHHLKAAIERALKVQSDEKENDIHFSIAIKNIDEQVLIDYCKEQVITEPKYMDVGAGFQLLYSSYFERGYDIVSLMGLQVKITNEEDHTN